jgi:methylated-DNA-[protein]-cysteine S-methyltransferase
MPRWTIVSPAPDTTLWIAASPEGLCHVSFREEIGDGWARDDGDALLGEAARQLALYFAGRLFDFDLLLDMKGTPFQRRVWGALREIPYGETRTYAQLASIVGAPKGFRAVGAANGKNPIPIIVPCHRVVESNGGLGGFSCGIAYKRRLLDLEQRTRAFELTAS